jgi:hypothetical protein
VLFGEAVDRWISAAVTLILLVDVGREQMLKPASLVGLQRERVPTGAVNTLGTIDFIEK